ncbi:MAG: kynureninase [Candidatus Heimdallarchaeota archaeon]
MTDYETGKSYADEMDAKDPLIGFRDKFFIPKGPTGKSIYFLGNSLGLQPKRAREYVEAVMADWEHFGVEAYFDADDAWLHYPDSLLDSSARIVGAKPAEVVLMNSLTVNLHLMLVSFYQPEQNREKILIEEKAFPSDQYAIKSQLRFHGINPDEALLEVKARPDETAIRADDITEFLEQEGESIALILLGGINYYSGQAFDLESIARIGHEKGCVVGFDLAHSAGNVPLRLHDWDVDFAVWCTYKYLNGGPNSPGGCFVHEKHEARQDMTRFEGWWGNKLETRFLMNSKIDPIRGAGGWQISCTSALRFAPLRASLEIFDKTSMDQLREKSVLLTSYLEFLIDQNESQQFTIITPKDPNQRGCQLSIRVHQKRKELFERLAKAGIYCDWREPDVIRVAPVPLYNTFNDVYRLANILGTLTKK